MNVQIATDPLAGIKILDLSSVIMGPFATHILGDFGADVIKIESPEGDSFRSYLPQRNPGMYGSFLNLNRNKRSICLDLKSEAGRKALNRLIAGADVFLHTMRPKAIDSLGYNYQRVRELKHDIIYCGAFGFGSAGPYRNKAAYDDLIQAGSGIAALNAEVHGSPAYVPTVVCDKLAGQTIAYSILACLFHRARGGGGQAIEVPMFETSIEFNLVEHMSGFAFQPPLSKPGFTRLLSKERKPFRTKNGYACILPYSDKNWIDFYRFTGRSEFLNDPRFQQLSSRVQHIGILYQLIEEEAVKRSTEEWVAFCDGVSIPCMPINSLQDLPADPHVRESALFENAEHPTEGSYQTVRRPVLLSDSPFQIRHHAPRLGEHTSEILREAGLSTAEIDEVLNVNAAGISSGQNGN